MSSLITATIDFADLAFLYHLLIFAALMSLEGNRTFCPYKIKGHKNSPKPHRSQF